MNVRETILARVKPTELAEELLGKPKQRSYRCWNSAAHANGDASPSLSISPNSGAWKCHGCQEKGDIFTLVQRVKNCNFKDALVFLADRCKVDIPKPKDVASSLKTKAIKPGNYLSRYHKSLEFWQSGKPLVADVLLVLLERYGINTASIKRWGLAWCQENNRLWIPVPENCEFEPGVDLNEVQWANFRQHDIMRRNGMWSVNGRQPKLGPNGLPVGHGVESLISQDFGQNKYEATGKVISATGHGGTFIYPMPVMESSPSVYLVGGELKALLLNQLGVPAVTFTCGEGAYNAGLLPMFIGKDVKVLFDADPTSARDTEGLSSIDHAASRLADELTKIGANAVWGYWPEEVRSRLPPKGDVTDLLKLAKWDVRALDFIEWREPRPKEAPVADEIDIERDFDSLSDPNMIGKRIKLVAQIAGQEVSQHVVPSSIMYTCEAGRILRDDKCAKCILPRCNYARTIDFNLEEKLGFVGQPPKQVMDQIRKESGVHVWCKKPDVELRWEAGLKATLVPPMDLGVGGELVTFRQADAVLLRDEPISIGDNSILELSGQLLPDPKRATFTFVSSRAKVKRGNVFDYKFKHEPHRSLLAAFDYTRGIDELLSRFGTALNCNACPGIWNQEEMIRLMGLSFFLPFRVFYHGEESSTVCQQVMILGDPGTGKSVTAEKLVRFFGAGRVSSMDENTSFAGLVGGTVGGTDKFMWGLLPACHRGLLVMDEYHRLDERVLRGLTGLISSGIAERTSVGRAAVQTPAAIRMLLLCNPRGTRALSDSSALDAVRKVMVTPQDLRRVLLAYFQKKQGKLVQRQLKRQEYYNEELARYHLRWAWSRKAEDYKFDCKPFGEKASNQSKVWGDHPLVLESTFRHKIAILAAGIAAAVYSVDPQIPDKVLVNDKHVAAAFEVFRRCYDDVMVAKPEVATSPEDLPPMLVPLFNSLDPKKLRSFLHHERYSRELLLGIVDNRTHIFDALVWDTHLMTPVKGGWYTPVEDFPVMLSNYLRDRQ